MKDPVAVTEDVFRKYGSVMARKTAMMDQTRNAVNILINKNKLKVTLLKCIISI